MSLVTEKFLICDGCGETIGVDCQHFTAKEHRDYARRYEGWAYRNGRDLCSVCKKHYKPITIEKVMEEG